VFPEAKDALFAFIEAESLIDGEELRHRIEKVVKDEEAQQKLLDLLFWYGFLGFVKADNSVLYLLRRVRHEEVQGAP
jgi:hypothetical protein